jgi:hypothetical protein
LRTTSDQRPSWRLLGCAPRLARMREAQYAKLRDQVGSGMVEGVGVLARRAFP